MTEGIGLMAANWAQTMCRVVWAQVGFIIIIYDAAAWYDGRHQVNDSSQVSIR
jgi:hypothetical protein